MKNNEDTISQINQIVRSGEGSEQLPVLILSLEGDVKNCVMSFSNYLIQEGDDKLLSLMLSNEAVLAEADCDKLWASACQYDDANVIDVCLSVVGQKGNITDLGALELMNVAIEKESLYAIKSLNDVFKEKGIMSYAISSQFPNISLSLVRGISDSQSLFKKYVEGWLTSLKKSLNDVWTKQHNETCAYWLKKQKDSVVYRVLDMAIAKRHVGSFGIGLLDVAKSEAIERFGETHSEKYMKRKVPQEFVLGAISDNSLELFIALNGSAIIENGRDLHKALEQLMQRESPMAFMKHLLLNAMPEVKDFVCKNLRMPYDRLSLHKTERPFFIENQEKEGYKEAMLFAYVCVMVDKFDMPSFAENARYEWHVEHLVNMGFTPFEVIQHLKSDELKPVALSLASIG